MTEDPKGLLFGALPSSDEASPAPAKTEGEAKWLLAAILAYYGEQAGSPGIRAAVHAADLARFGGDPEEKIGDLEAEIKYLLAGIAEAKTDAQAARIAELEAQIAQLEREGSELSANQCHNGYAGEHGDHMCKYQDRIAELEEQIAADAEHFEGIEHKAQHWALVFAKNKLAECRWVQIRNHARHRATLARTSLQPKGSER